MDKEFVDKSIISKETNDRIARPLCIKCHKEGEKPVIFGRKKTTKLKKRKRSNTYVCPKVTGHRQKKLIDKFHRIKPKLSPL